MRIRRAPGPDRAVVRERDTSVAIGCNAGRCSLAWDFKIVDVFTDRPLAGNQLAVVLDAEGLDPATMQAVAREFNFSETTFVTPSQEQGCDWRVRIFTPLYELPMAGHPTVGTAVVLRQEGRIESQVVFELGVGPTPVAFDSEGLAWMTQPEATFGPEVEDRELLASALSLTAQDLRDDLPAQVVSCGNEFLFIPIASLEALGRMRANMAVWEQATSSMRRGGVFGFVETSRGWVRARMFAPTMGVPEDPATGSAAGPLGAYFARHLGVTSLLVEQGVEMGRPSTLHVDATAARPRVGGRAVTVASGRLQLPG
ncbi:MAG: PhzF family phenazine biosynthesis protein [Candidatus Nephthysia bennettiae]|nr:MAG: PhzF family phenazine biosynthesis protein [Candidatus Dormibacteraeota bacterium]